jgi:hypothetical protein
LADLTGAFLIPSLKIIFALAFNFQLNFILILNRIKNLWLLYELSEESVPAHRTVGERSGIPGRQGASCASATLYTSSKVKANERSGRLKICYNATKRKIAL